MALMLNIQIHISALSPHSLKSAKSVYIEEAYTIHHFQYQLIEFHSYPDSLYLYVDIWDGSDGILLAMYIHYFLCVF